MIEAVYDHLEYMEDSSMDVIDVQNRNPIKVEGLYCVIDGEHVTPHTVWFGCHFYRYDHKYQNYGGLAYWHYLNALHPVFTEDGEHYRVPQLRNVSARYDGEVLSGFYRE